MADCKDISEASFTVKTDGERGNRKITSTRAFLFETVRLETFYYFKYKTSVDIEKLARRGYFYDRFSDDVRCYFCPSKLSHKNNYEEPSSHARDDKCKLGRYPFNGNVPIIDDKNPEDSHDALNSLLHKCLNYNITDSCTDDNTAIDFNEKLAFNELEFVFAEGIDSKDFSKEEVRLSTFDPWFPYLPESDRPKKETFAKAGFVYTGISDVVMCFKCKGGLFNTIKSDDPIDDHVKFYGYCPFVREAFPGNSYYMCRGLMMMMFSKEETLLMSHPLIKNLILKGYDEQTVKRWISVYVSIYSCFPTDIKMCIKELTKTIEKSKK